MTMKIIKIKTWLKNKKGQNTVEYLLMLTVIVGVVLLVGIGIKNYLPGLLTKIEQMISGSVDTLGK